MRDGYEVEYVEERRGVLQDKPLRWYWQLRCIANGRILDDGPRDGFSTIGSARHSFRRVEEVMQRRACG